jgi:hypothetical protein
MRLHGRSPASARTHSFPSSPLPDGLHPRGHGRKNNYFILFYLKFFLVVVAGLKREKKNFGFRFSIPKIPKLRGRSREKNKVFSA